MDKSPTNATVHVAAPPATTGTVYNQSDAVTALPVSGAVTPTSEETPKKEPRHLKWADFFKSRDWVRGVDGSPEEVLVKKKVKNKEGVEEEKTFGTGRYKVRNLHLPGDTIVDGNGDSYLVLPDMSLRAVSKYHRRAERKQRREDRRAQRKEARSTTQRGKGVLKSESKESDSAEE